jgi:hypothetical protein
LLLILFAPSLDASAVFQHLRTRNTSANLRPNPGGRVGSGSIMARSGLRQLYEHRTIALDFDNTLIGHPNSLVLQEFVLNEVDRRQFWIVTHRSAGAAGRLWRNLYHESFGRLSQRQFAGVAHLPLHIYDAWCAQMEAHAAGTAVHSSDRDERTFIEWKAATARNLGCTALVDDLVALHKEPCCALGILFVATDWL